MFSGRQRQPAAQGARPAGRVRADRRRLVRPGKGLRQGAPHRLLQDLALPRLHRGTHGSGDVLKRVNVAESKRLSWRYKTLAKFEHEGNQAFVPQEEIINCDDQGQQ